MVRLASRSREQANAEQRASPANGTGLFASFLASLALRRGRPRSPTSRRAEEAGIRAAAGSRRAVVIHTPAAAALAPTCRGATLRHGHGTTVTRAHSAVVW
ncbi:unnamed protein product [Lota lota]